MYIINLDKTNEKARFSTKRAFGYSGRDRTMSCLYTILNVLEIDRQTQRIGDVAKFAAAFIGVVIFNAERKAEG